MKLKNTFTSFINLISLYSHILIQNIMYEAKLPLAVEQAVSSKNFVKLNVWFGVLLRTLFPVRGTPYQSQTSKRSQLFSQTRIPYSCRPPVEAEP